MLELADSPYRRDPLSQDGIADLPAFYRELRDDHPVYYCED